MSDLKQFSFFRSYYMSLKNLTPEEIGQIVIFMARYMFEDEELPDCEGVHGAVLELIRPILYKSKTKALAGQIGGESKPEANPKQNESTTEAMNKPEPKRKRNKEKGKRIKNINNPPSPFEPPTWAEVMEYCFSDGRSHVDPGVFYETYNSIGWMMDGEPIDWKAKIKEWEEQAKEDDIEKH